MSGTTTSHFGTCGAKSRSGKADIAVAGKGDGSRRRAQNRSARRVAIAAPVKLTKNRAREATTSTPQRAAGTRSSPPTKGAGKGHALPEPNNARAGAKLHGKDLAPQSYASHAATPSVARPRPERARKARLLALALNSAPFLGAFDQRLEPRPQFG